MAAPIRRIVSLVPSTTASVFALDCGDRLVGCTRYCDGPESVQRVGGTKNPALEAIAALRPDLVLVNAEENEPDHIAWLRARLPVLQHTPLDVAEACSDLRELALHLDAGEAVQPLLLRIEAQLAAAEVRRLGQPNRRVFYAVWPTPWMSVNRHTFISDVLRLAGADNVCADAAARYPEVTPAAVLARRPDLVLLPSEPWEFDTEQRDELARAHTFGGAALVLCDGRDFCWHGAW
ncbi:MAG: ABC transporter substrate-binding protein, partial [Planctomycetes bacterium]|nr:ABC transporter substrate-binding protein [Planctomycetota bacterium]